MTVPRPIPLRHDPSGLPLAQAAHESGQVTPSKELPNHEATITIRFHGDGADVRELVERVTERIIGEPLVVDLDYAVRER